MPHPCLKSLPAVVLAVVLVLALPLRPALSAMQHYEPDPNALADALMGAMGAYIDDSTNLSGDETADAQLRTDIANGEAQRKLEEELRKKNKNDEPKKPNEEPQNEDVIPLAGDSSAPPDEIMDGGPTLLLVSLRPPHLPAPLPGIVTIFSGFRDGVIQMRIFSPDGLSTEQRRRVMRTRTVLTPISTADKEKVERWIEDRAQRGSGVHVTSVAMRGYCVEPAKQAPSADAMFLAGPPPVQEQFKPMRLVRTAAEFAAAHGYLKPQGDPAAYGRFITQYAIWTTLEHWDLPRFTREFLTRSRQSMTAAKKPWTGETEQTLRALAPARWRDLRLVLDAAERVDARLRISKGAK